MDKIVQLINGAYNCEPHSMAAFRAQMLMALRNGTVQALEDDLTKNSKIKSVVYAMHSERAEVNTVERWDITDASIPDNSVAVLFYEGMTFPWKTYSMEEQLQYVYNNPRIIGAVIFLNTPGGYVHRVDQLSDSIRNSPKPIAAYITGMCCSAGQWFSSSCKRVFSASEMDVHGSIGTMTTWINDAKFWESMGIEFKDLYSDLSPNKNHISREAETGNFEPLIAELNYMTEVFHNRISTNRNIPIDASSSVFDGSDFRTAKAISLKLCDQQATFDEVLNWVLMEGMKKKSKSI